MPKTDSPKKARRRASNPPSTATAPDLSTADVPAAMEIVTSNAATSALTGAPSVARPPSTTDPDNVVAPSPTYDEIAQAAYQRYLDRGSSDGQDFDDWIEAERTLKHGR